ncbi:hypothetical protein HDU98_005653, partial [Podochytrium sp. JEL0797]
MDDHTQRNLLLVPTPTMDNVTVFGFTVQGVAQTISSLDSMLTLKQFASLVPFVPEIASSVPLDVAKRLLLAGILRERELPPVDDESMYNLTAEFMMDASVVPALDLMTAKKYEEATRAIMAWMAKDYETAFESASKEMMLGSLRETGQKGIRLTEHDCTVLDAIFRCKSETLHHRITLARILGYQYWCLGNRRKAVRTLKKGIVLVQAVDVEMLASCVYYDRQMKPLLEYLLPGGDQTKHICRVLGEMLVVMEGAPGTDAIDRMIMEMQLHGSLWPLPRSVG